jgi:hypothetical protein
MLKTILLKITTLMLVFLTSCHSYTYVKYNRKGQGDITTKKGIGYEDPDFGNPTVHPRFRSKGPMKQGLRKIKRAQKRKKNA